MFCKNCGKQLNDNTKFCKYCGTKIVPKNQAVPAPQAAPTPQPVPTPQATPTPSPKPRVESAPPVGKEVKAPKKKSGGSVIIVIEIIVVIILLIAIAVGAWFLFKDGKIKDIGLKKGDKEQVEEILSEGEETDASEGGSSLGFEEALENGEFEDAIEALLDLDTDVVEEHADEVKEAFVKALDGHMEAVFADVDKLMENGEFVDAYDVLDDELSYRSEVAKKFDKAGFSLEVAFEDSKVEEKREDVTEKYKNDVISKADAASDISDAQAIFRDADKYIEGDDYEAEKTKVYTHIVLSRLGSMQQKGEDTSTAKSYIVSNLSLVDNNCWVLEFWDYFNAIDAMNGVYTVPDGKVNHISSDGYILPDSDSRELSESDIAGFSKIECKLARFEIYARHGRGFNDAAITKFFSNYSWYSEQISYDKFDESVLTEIERKNRDLIVQYEKSQGYL